MSLDPGALVTGAAAVLLTAVFGKPAWQLARHRLKAQRAAEKAEEDRQELRLLAGAVAKVLTGTDNPDLIPDPSPENPSLQDLLHDALEETAALTSAVALLQHAVELHLAVPHGGEIPDWVTRAVAMQQKNVGRRW
ncbi:MAG TPA: hypothetical protein VM782_01245 [Stellaceae bacterium]|nr:hypothetical protein [Stellaceae bacterium]